MKRQRYRKNKKNYKWKPCGLTKAMQNAATFQQARWIFDTAGSDKNVIHYNVMLTLAWKFLHEDDPMKLRKYTLVLLHEMEKFGIEKDVIIYNSAIRAADGDHQMVKRLIQRMKKEGLEPNVRTFNTAIRSLGGNHKWVRKLVAEMKEKGIEKDIITFNTSIAHFHDDYDEVDRLLAEMDQKGIRRDPYTYSSLINAHHGDHRYVKQILTEMSERGVEMDTVTYSNAIRGTEDSVIDTTKLFGELEQSGVKPDYILVDAMLDSYAKRGKIELGMQLFSKYCKFSFNPTKHGRSLSCHKRSAGYAFFQIMKFYQENMPALKQISVCTGKSSGDRYMKMREEVMYFIAQNCPKWSVTPGCNQGVITVHFPKVAGNTKKRRRYRKKQNRKQEENASIKKDH